MTSSVRLFVGIDVSVKCANELAGGAKALRETIGDVDLSWVAPARYHVTLKYLGWTARAVIPAVRDRLEVAAQSHAEFDFRVAQLGCFPSPDKARVLWAGVSSESLRTLARQVDSCLEPLGFQSDNREFIPHVTLARAAKVADLERFVLGSEHRYSTTRCQQINIFESSINSDGSGYPVLASLKLSSRNVRGRV